MNTPQGYHVRTHFIQWNVDFCVYPPGMLDTGEGFGSTCGNSSAGGGYGWGCGKYSSYEYGVGYLGNGGIPSNSCRDGDGISNPMFV